MIAFAIFIAIIIHWYWHYYAIIFAIDAITRLDYYAGWCRHFRRLIISHIFAIRHFSIDTLSIIFASPMPPCH
jgi:hypothetical protein